MLLELFIGMVGPSKAAWLELAFFCLSAVAGWGARILREKTNERKRREKKGLTSGILEDRLSPRAKKDR